MKKEYEKPIVELVEFEVSDAIAGSCRSKVQASEPDCTEVIDPDPNLLTLESACKESLDEAYCVYTPNDNILTS